MNDLDRLIEAVEGGDWGNPKDAFPDHKTHMLGFKAYHGSLDAAKALHEALLTGWLHHTGWTQGVPTIFATVWHPREEWEEITSTGPHEARAWLIAIIKAYRSQISKA